MKKLISLVLVLVLLTLATSVAFAGGPIVHKVSAGGPDACVGFGEPPGCDANFSLTAKERADGSVSGQWTDRWPQGDGFHAVIDCLVVEGNTALVSGVITHGTSGDLDLTGMEVFTAVRDNGTSANQPPDEISFSWLGFDEDGDPLTFDCTNPPEDWEDNMFIAPQGQVKVN